MLRNAETNIYYHKKEKMIFAVADKRFLLKKRKFFVKKISISKRDSF